MNQTYLFGIVAIFGAIIAIFSIKFSKKFNFIYYALTALLCDSLSLTLSLFTTPPLLFLFFAVILPLFMGIGLLYAPLVDRVWKTYPNKG